MLQDPEPPDVELRGFGESGIDFGGEFWVNGIDDGKNKYASDVLFLIWNALKENGIDIPYPHRVIEMRTGPAAAPDPSPRACPKPVRSRSRVTLPSRAS